MDVIFQNSNNENARPKNYVTPKKNNPQELRMALTPTTTGNLPSRLRMPTQVDKNSFSPPLQLGSFGSFSPFAMNDLGSFTTHESLEELKDFVDELGPLASPLITKPSVSENTKGIIETLANDTSLKLCLEIETLRKQLKQFSDFKDLEYQTQCESIRELEEQKQVILGEAVQLQTSLEQLQKTSQTERQQSKEERERLEDELTRQRLNHDEVVFKLSQDNNDLSQRVKQLEEQLNKAEEEKKQLQVYGTGLEEQLLESNMALEEHKQTAITKSRELELSQQQIITLEGELKTLNREITAFKEKFVMSKSSNQESERKINHLEEQLEEAERNSRSLQFQLQLAFQARQVSDEALKMLKSEFLEQEKTLKLRIESLEEFVKRSEGSVEELKREKVSKDLMLEESKNSLKLVQKEVERLTMDITLQSNMNDDANHKICEKEMQIELLEEKSQQNQIEIENLKKSIEMLQQEKLTLQIEIQDRVEELQQKELEMKQLSIKAENSPLSLEMEKELLIRQQQVKELVGEIEFLKQQCEQIKKDHFKDLEVLENYVQKAKTQQRELDRISREAKNLMSERDELERNVKEINTQLFEAQQNIKDLTEELEQKELELTLSTHDKEILMLNMESLILAEQFEGEQNITKLLFDKLNTERELSGAKLQHEAEQSKLKLQANRLKEELDLTTQQISEYKQKVDEKIQILKNNQHEAESEVNFLSQLLCKVREIISNSDLAQERKVIQVTKLLSDHETSFEEKTPSPPK